MFPRVTYPLLALLTSWLAVGLPATAQELYTVKPVKTNLPDKNEFCAVPYEKGYVFCSDRLDYSALKFETTKGAKVLVNLFAADNDSTAEVKSADPFNSVLHDGPIVFFDNNTKAVLTRNLSEKSKLRSVYKDTRLGLFFFEKQNGKWVETGAFPYNNYTYSCGHAAINEDGTLLIFSSDMPGGFGSSDLYYSSFSTIDSNWTLPANLGQIVNSPGKEMFPFLHSSGTLYYSSNGKKGKGGFDVFHTVGGYPYQKVVRETDDVNSPQDDFGLWLTPDFSTGFLTSNRAGTDDIYTVSLTYPEFTNCTDYQEVSFCYEFFEAASLNVDTIPMVYEWDFGDGTTKKGLSAYHCYNLPGVYTVQLNVFDTVLNALFMNEATYELEIADINQPIMEVPDSANPGVPFQVNAGQARFTDFVIAEYYWYFGDSNKNSKGQRFPVTLNTPGVYDVILGVASAPDKDGHSQTRCFKKQIVVTVDSVSQPLADDSRDASYNKLPGGAHGTSYLIAEDQDGLFVTQLRPDGTPTSTVSNLPNEIFYMKVLPNGDTVVTRMDVTPENKKLLDTFLNQAENPTQTNKNGVTSFTAFLPSDSVKYPQQREDVRKYYNAIDSLVRRMYSPTKLPDAIVKSLTYENVNESDIVFNTNTHRVPTYNTTANTSVSNDSTTVFYKQVTTNPTNPNITNTTQYATNEKTDSTQNGHSTSNSNKTDSTNTAQNTNRTNVDSTNTNQNKTDSTNTTQNTNRTNVDSTNTNSTNTAQNKTDSTTTNQNKTDSTNTAQNTNRTNVDSTNTNTAQNKTDSTTTNQNKTDTTNTAQNTNSTNIDSTNTNQNKTDSTNTTQNTNRTNVDSTNTNQNKTDSTNTTQNTNRTNVDSTNTNQNKTDSTHINRIDTTNTSQNGNKTDADTLNKKSDTLEITLDILRSFTHPDLQYKVQIGAYRYPWNFKYQKYKEMGQRDEQEKLSDGITRITLGRFKTLNEAYIFRDKVRSDGIPDTFVTAVYKGRRYYLFELKTVLKGVINPQ